MAGENLILDCAGAESIHEATLTVLEKTGLRLEHSGAEALLIAAGARKDGGRVLLPRELVQDALERCPRSFGLWDRQGSSALELACGHTYFGPGSDALHQIDRATLRRRDATLKDVGENARLAEALDLDFVMSMALPRDVGPRALYPRVFAEMVRGTSRPLVFTAVTLRDIERIHHIACLVAGGAEVLRARPFLVAYLEPLSPLHFDREAVDKLFYCVDHAIPFIFAAGANCGIGAPITPEGGVVQGSAESLAGLAIATQRSPAPRFVYGSNTSSADMRSGMVCYGAPEWSRTVAIYAALGELYDLPSWGTAGCTDALEIDAQATWEACRSILLAQNARPTLVHDMGYMAFGELFDPRFLALSTEILREIRHTLAPADLSPEALSTQVIDQVARTGSLYLAHPDTRRRFRETLWISRLISRDRVGQTPVTMPERLARRVDEVLAAHTPQPLDPHLWKELEGYLAAIDIEDT